MQSLFRVDCKSSSCRITINKYRMMLISPIFYLVRLFCYCRWPVADLGEGPPSSLFWIKKFAEGRKTDRVSDKKRPPPPLLSSRSGSTTGDDCGSIASFETLTLEDFLLRSKFKSFY